MAGGAQGNFNMQRPGFTPGGVNDPAQGGSGYTTGGSASWGGNYGNQINPGVGTGYQNLLPSMGDGSPQNWNVPYSGPAMGIGGQNYLPSMGYGSPWSWNVPYTGPYMGVGGQGNPPGVQQVTHTTPAATNTTDPFAGIDAERLAQAQRFANAGLFGRAKQQIGLGGGNWDNVGGLLRQQAGETDNYGGDWNWGKASDADVAQAQAFAKAGMYGRAKQVMGDNWTTDMSRQLRGIDKTNPYTKGTSMGFDWGDVSAGRLAKAKEFATAGKMGRAKQMYERGGGKWSPTISNQFRAWAKANQ